MNRLVFTRIEGEFESPEAAAIVIGQAVAAMRAVPGGASVPPSPAAIAASEDPPSRRAPKQLPDPEPEVLPRKKAERTPAVQAVRGGELTIIKRCFEALKKKPMSSLELAVVLKLDPPQVYSPCNQLKEKGLVESRNDAGDGTRRWFVIGKGGG